MTSQSLRASGAGDSLSDQFKVEEVILLMGVENFYLIPENWDSHLIKTFSYLELEKITLDDDSGTITINFYCTAKSMDKEAFAM